MKKGNIENIIKDKLSNFEYEFSEIAWDNFNKKIPQTKFSRFYKYGPIIVASLILISSLTLLFYPNNTLNENNIKQKYYSPIPYSTEDKTIRKADIIIENNRNESIDYKYFHNNNSSDSENISNLNTESSQLSTINNTAHNIDNNIIQQLPNSKFKISKTEGCQPLTVNFIPNEISDTIIYLWDFGDGKFSNEKIPTHTYIYDDKYKAKLTVKYYHSEELVTSKNQIIEVFSKPNVDFKWELNDNQVQFINRSDYSNKTKWQFGEYNESSFESDPEYTFKTNGVHLVSLCISNEFGCINTISKPINIDIKYDIFVPEAFIPNNDGKNEVFGVKTIIEVENFEMNIIDKNGNIVFQSGDINNHWNGKINGTDKNADSGIYIWEYTFKDKFGNIISDKGRVQLIR